MFSVHLAEFQIKVDAETAENIQGDAEFAEKYLNMLRRQFPIEGGSIEDMEEDSQQDMDSQRTELTEAVSDNSTSSNKKNFKWNHKIIMLLFEVYRENKENFKNGNHKVAWRKVATEMTDKGYVLNWQQCQIKMDTLKRRYKNIKDSEKSTGASPITWEYYAIMDELFGNKKWSKPLAGAISSTEVNNATAKIDQPKPGSSKSSTTKKKVEEKIEEILYEFREEKKKRNEDIKKRK